MAEQRDLPFTRKNWTLAAAGLASILIGYLCLRIPPAEGFLSLTLAPVLLVAGYCVLIPLAILAKGQTEESDSP
ncbi:MAG TPA: hypothetical protein EYG11_22085 [Candidatus Latescibacteria bacterium]|nr:hypothetical protein [Candidatus Handelsmanbacteria bacterium]HIL11390.1 hypothetical protein [Candidatus Latescibacterota bacterium]